MSEESTGKLSGEQRKTYVGALQAERESIAARPAEDARTKATRSRRLGEIDKELTRYGDQPNGAGGIETA